MILWSTKRRFIYGGGVALIFLVVLFLLAWNIFYNAPTCNDGKKNGDEKGIDCGGSCSSLCTSDALSPVVLWSKIFHISGDVYTAVAFVENPNVNSKNDSAQYRFKIFDEENKLIVMREGVTSIPKNKKFAVFEAGIVLKNRKPKSVDFEFISFTSWQKDETPEPEISIKYGTITSTSTTPKITGTISNKSIDNIKKIELVVAVLDNKENTVATSRTYIDNLLRNSTQEFVFTWPKPLNIGVESCVYPLDLIVALDRSGSMRSENVDPPEPFNTVINTAKNFINNLTDEDQVAVTSFGTNSKQESTLSLNKNVAIEAINNLSLGTTTEQTNITEGLASAFNELKSSRGRVNSKSVLVLLTDGIPTEPKRVVADYPMTSAQAISAQIKDSGITIYTIGLGKEVSDQFLKSISSDAGHYFYAPNKEMLSDIYNKITSNLCIKKPNVINVIYRVL
ncbi:MAG TPA: hypothetical protein DEV73_00260 [Candidatus Zambryskibacteria bacterium]|nr:MAG: hypothetical protein UT25_C0003G0079 [Parcubacteria group bacterium GW2011_GWC1_39_12]KKR18963.1 MAG: hypothetical protein UT49_C0005G0030 [Parcubacteria group bacterium GW2011_GWF1_39_37]KKR35482.1 MAG: hypothetical protein UT68_C0003G0058 [Parcubacteria group bacterium GW2011_GWC2_40_10]KKR51972.1 MAG: hypothetical protein UT89_C0004G0057 [Parcubacteria group bacterium GW2011_GWE1_40_20]KKR68473.1 MAG: hypothetical protein UU11_C0011G0019 [Parcubacteria group bacterium GW2011_GWF2_40_